MVKSYAIELHFDFQLKDKILDAWKILKDRRIGSIDPNNTQPHITLAVIPTTEPKELHEAINEFTKSQGDFPVSLSLLAIFPKDLSIVLVPTPNLRLLNFHSALCDHLHKCGFKIIEQYLTECWWQPHCPLVRVRELCAQGDGDQVIEDALNVVKELNIPFNGIASSLGLVQFSPTGCNLSPSFHDWNLMDEP